jgi:hypothetical protein
VHVAGAAAAAGLAAALAIAPGCGGGGEAPTVAPQLGEIQAHIFGRSCVFSSCHGSEGPQQGMSLVAPVHATLVGHASTEVPQRSRVVPGDPDASYLLEKLESDKPVMGERMPPGQPLSGGQIAAIRQWIQNGAADD